MPRYLLSITSILILTAAIAVFWLWQSTSDSRAAMDPDDAELVALGAELYRTHCAPCHGTALEGQPNWQQRKADGRLPAPPHDQSGHSWHHPGAKLFAITKQGTEAFAPEGYKTDMAAFGEMLSDREIWAVLSYIKSTWPEAVRQRHDEIEERAAQP